MNKKKENTLFRQFADMEQLFYKLFHPTHPFHRLIEKAWRPFTDVRETDNDILITVELAGANKNDITINYHSQQLTIRGTRQEPEGRNTLSYHQMEINYGQFERIIYISEEVDSDHIKASYKDGFLTIEIPKKQKKNESFKIEVSDNS